MAGTSDVSPGYRPYEPQLVPVIRADNLWTVEGPEVAYRLTGLTIPCPTRMTVIRLGDGTLCLHSPISMSDDICRLVDDIGKVSVLIAPNSYHYVHLKAWADKYRSADVLCSPGAIAKVGIDRAVPLGSDVSKRLANDLDQYQIDLGEFTETIFFHRVTRTLIVTDLMQNFESSRAAGLFTRFLLVAGGAAGPNGRPSIEIRLAARKHRDALRKGVQQMLAWQPSRIILSHGLCFEENAVAEIRRAFAVRS